MSGFAKLRDGEGTWFDQDLKCLDGTPFDPTGLPSYVKSICFDGMLTGLYVLTDDDDHYFTCPSIVLDFLDDTQVLPLLEREMSNG